MAWQGVGQGPARLWLQPHEGWRAQLLSPSEGEALRASGWGSIQDEGQKDEHAEERRGSDLLGKTNPLPIKEMPSSLPLPAQEFSNLKKVFKLEYTCFAMLCQLLLYDNVNQLYEYIYPLPHGPLLPTTSSL